MPVEVPPLTLRLEKGSPLSAQEGDDNFKALRDAVNALWAFFGITLNSDGTLKNDSVSTASIQDRAVTMAKLSSIFIGTAAGTDTYTLTLSPVITAYAQNQIFFVKFPNANTIGNPTLNVDGVGAVGIKRFGNTEIEVGDLVANQFYVLIYDTTGTPKFQIVGTLGIQTIFMGVAAGGDAYTLALTPSLTGYVQNQVFIVKFPTANTTTSPTLNVSAQGAISIRKQGNTAVAIGDIAANQFYILIYDTTGGAKMQIIGGSLGGGAQGYAQLKYVVATGVGGGGTAIGYNDRNVNTIVVNIGSYMTGFVGATNFKLAAGNYWLRADGKNGNGVSLNFFDLYNVTDGAVVANSQGLNNNGENLSCLAYVSIAAEKEFKIRHYSSVATGITGQGAPNSIAGASEVYLTIEIERE